MTVNLNDVIRVTVKSSLPNGSSILNVYHLKKIGGGDLSESDALVDIINWVELLNEQLDDVQVTTLTYDSVDAYNVTQDRPVSSGALTGGGTLAADPLPPGVAALISTDTGQKRGVGRKYIAGISEALTTGGEFIAGALVDLAGYADLLTEVYNSGTTDADWQAGIYKKLGAQFHPFIGWLVSAIPAYQRRRKPGVGS